MTEDSKDYIAIPITSMKDCFRDIPCDVYLEISTGYYVKTFDKRTGIDFQRLANYESKDVEVLYIKKGDIKNFETFVAKSPMAVLSNPKFDIKQKKEAFIAATEQAICEAFEKIQIPDAVANKVIDTINSAIVQELKFVDLLKSLVTLSGNRDSHYRHAIGTSVHAYLLLNKLGMMSDRSIKIILFSSLFHDIGKLTFPEHKRTEKDYESLEEIRKFHKHPIISSQMVGKCLNYADEEIRRCILEHKERADGKGYPNELRNVQIYELSKILAIAEYFSEMTLGLTDGKKYSIIQALSIMKADPGQFDQKIFIPFYELLQQVFKQKKAA